MLAGMVTALLQKGLQHQVIDFRCWQFATKPIPQKVGCYVILGARHKVLCPLQGSGRHVQHNGIWQDHSPEISSRKVCGDVWHMTHTVVVALFTKSPCHRSCEGQKGNRVFQNVQECSCFTFLLPGQCTVIRYGVVSVLCTVKWVMLNKDLLLSLLFWGLHLRYTVDVHVKMAELQVRHCQTLALGRDHYDRFLQIILRFLIS